MENDRLNQAIFELNQAVLEVEGDLRMVASSMSILGMDKPADHLMRLVPLLQDRAKDVTAAFCERLKDDMRQTQSNLAATIMLAFKRDESPLTETPVVKSRMGHMGLNDTLANRRRRERHGIQSNILTVR